VLLLATGIASAAEITLSVSLASAPGAVPFNFNPRAGNGLLAVASAGYDFAVSQTRGCPLAGDAGSTTVTAAASAAAAGYGSDTSIDGRYNLALLGTAVEPMADAQVEASISRSSNCVGNLPFQSQPVDASVGGSVNHRVVARPLAVELGPMLDALADIPVRLDYALATRSSGNASAFAGFYVELDGQRLFGREARPATNQEVSGTWSTAVRRTTLGQEFLYKIAVSAIVDAVPTVYTNNGTDSASAQAVADPFLYVDPDWEFARYFMVQQESVANPGEWVEVTREWQGTVVPLPGGFWLAVSAGAALLTVVRRRAAGGATPETVVDPVPRARGR
jgi:hypothetical protein